MMNSEKQLAFARINFESWQLHDRAKRIEDLEIYDDGRYKNSLIQGQFESWVAAMDKYGVGHE